NLKGWRLNAGDPGQDFIFPDFNLQPGQSCRVYTNENHPESCGFSFGNSKQALWNNDGDCGYLYDAAGALVDKRCYS
ncbi:MAG: lamin tail domain-containing protein, partial [Chloroflexi bacterium]|nr:lamin tail domain-containing protein [Chloroflexota bacterium]